MEQSPNYKAACHEIISNLTSGKGFTEEDLETITKLPDSCSSSGQFHSVLLEKMSKLKDDPVVALLEQPAELKKSFNFLFCEAEYRNNAKVCICNNNKNHTFHIKTILSSS